MNALAKMEDVIINGNLETLKPEERVLHYKRVCESQGLNPLTKPFEYMKYQGKMTLYARKDCTDQLRRIHNISIKITSRERMEDIYVVTAQAINAEGRTDESIGAINIAGLKGDALANALMKCETKAKRRVTLSFSGLGLLDEHEVSSVKGAQRVNIDIETGEILESSGPQLMITQDQVFDLSKLLYDSKANQKEFLKFYKVDNLNQLTESQYMDAIDKLKIKMIKSLNDVENLPSNSNENIVNA